MAASMDSFSAWAATVTADNVEENTEGSLNTHGVLPKPTDL